MKKEIASAIVFTLLAIMLTSASRVASSTLPLVYVDPPLSFANKGESFTVDIMVADVERLYSWQINMSFDPNVLQFVNVTEGDFLKDQPEGTWTVPPIINNTAGWVVFCWTTYGPHLGVSGSGWLATVEFLVVGTGESVLNIDNELTKLLEYFPPPPPPGKDVIEEIPHTIENGLFTNLVTPPVAQFSYQPSNPVIDQIITFDASPSSAAPPNEIVEYYWVFGDGTTASDTTPTIEHTYAIGGTVIVALTVFDNATASDLIQSIYGTTSMPRIWYELYGTYKEAITITFRHDVAVTDIQVSPTEVIAGEIVYVDVSVLNKGSETETFNVTTYYAYYAYYAIDTKLVIGLAPGRNETLRFAWNTANVPTGTYMMSATATLEDEQHPDDNNFVDGPVAVELPPPPIPIWLLLLLWLFSLLAWLWRFW